MDIKIKRLPFFLCTFIIGIALVLGFSEDSRTNMLIDQFGNFVLVGCAISLGFIVKSIIVQKNFLNIVPTILFVAVYVLSGFAQIEYISLEGNLDIQLYILSSMGIVVYAFRKDAKEHLITKEAKQMQEELEKEKSKILSKVNSAKDFKNALIEARDGLHKMLGIKDKKDIKSTIKVANRINPESGKDYTSMVFEGNEPSQVGNDTSVNEEIYVHSNTSSSKNNVTSKYKGKELLNFSYEKNPNASFQEMREKHVEEVIKNLTKFQVFDFKNQANKAVAGPKMALLFGKENLAEVRLGDQFPYHGNVLMISADLESYGLYEEEYTIIKGNKTIYQGIEIVSKFQHAFTKMVENQEHPEKQKNAVYRYVGDQNISLVENPEKFYERFLENIRNIYKLNEIYKPIEGSRLQIRVRIGLDTGPYKITMDGTEKQRDPNITSDHLITAVRLEGYAKSFGLLHLFSEEAIRFFGKSEKFQYLGTFETMRPDRKLKLYACEEFENIYRKDDPISLNDFSIFIQSLEKEVDKDIIATKLASFDYPTDKMEELFNKYSDCFIEHKRIIFKTKKN